MLWRHTTCKAQQVSPLQTNCVHVVKAYNMFHLYRRTDELCACCEGIQHARHTLCFSFTDELCACCEGIQHVRHTSCFSSTDELCMLWRHTTCEATCFSFTHELCACCEGIRHVRHTPCFSLTNELCACCEGIQHVSPLQTNCVHVVKAHNM